MFEMIGSVFSTPLVELLRWRPCSIFSASWRALFSALFSLWTTLFSGALGHLARSTFSVFIGFSMPYLIFVCLDGVVYLVSFRGTSTVTAMSDPISLVFSALRWASLFASSLTNYLFNLLFSFLSGVFHILGRPAVFVSIGHLMPYLAIAFLCLYRARLLSITCLLQHFISLIV